MTTRGVEPLPSPPSYAQVGDVFAGKYRIERVLGRGGMGIVVAASHVKLRQTVAIKFVLQSSLGGPRLATRLLREARAAAALRGEHVARVFDVDVVNGVPYIVMEYLEGQTLASLLETSGPLGVTPIADYALEACEALAEAHALGIVHRDLKPSNLFLARGPGGRQSLRVLDFGISKALDERAEPGGTTPEPVDGDRDGWTFSGTDSHAFVGSPPYVSPEQLIRPREADPRSDIWSLGVVLYQCYSGRLPFRGTTLPDLWDSILREPLPAFGADEASFSPELERIVRRCLEKESGLRYADVHELGRELASLGSGRARASLEVIEGLAPHEADAIPTAQQSGQSHSVKPEHDATVSEAPTSERTPSGVVASSRFAPFRARAGVLMAMVVALAGAFVAHRQLQHVGSPTRQPIASHAPLAVSEVAAGVAVDPVPASDVPASTPADTKLMEAPPSAVSRARTRPIRREQTPAKPPLAPSSLSEPPPVDVLTRAETLLGQGQLSEACAVGQVALATAADSPKVLEFLGRCSMRLGAVDQARVYYRKYLDLAPTAPNAAFVRAMLEPRPQ